MLYQDLLLQVGSCVALTGNLGYNVHQDAHAEKSGLVYETNGGYTYTGCAGKTFILTGVGEVFY